MAESIVMFLVEKITPIIQDEVKLLGGVSEEVQYIKDELERMRAFLRVSDEKEESDPELQVWVKQVRDVAYCTEDVLDEFILRLTSHHRRDGFYGFLRRICWSIKVLKARHRIASEIQSIKNRVDNIFKGHQRFAERYGISEQGSSSTRAANTWHDRRNDALLLEESELVGIDKPKRQLINWLLDDRDSGLKVVSVVGMGGLGKTTLVKKVYEDAKVKNHFQNHAWITVSQSFKIEEVLKDLIRQLYDEAKKQIPQTMETTDSRELKALIIEFLQQRRYVVVLDDVWDFDAWNAIKISLPNGNHGSRILLTTRNYDVASSSSFEPRGNIYEMKPLSPEESWTLFCRKLQFPEGNCPPHLHQISERILAKCDGLPIAIVAIVGVLALKDMSRKEEWDMVHRSLGDELESNDKLTFMKRILSLSYYDLPYHLKSCFLYLSIFPEDHPMEKMRVIRLWTAEGFVQVREGKTIEEVAENYLNELVHRSLVQLVEATKCGTLKTCRIHDLFCEIIVSKSREQNFVTIASKRDKRWPEQFRRLSIHDSLENLQESECLNRLRSLLIFGVEDLPSRSSISMLLLHGRLLKVLDLRGVPLMETIPDEVFKLIHLMYLSLRGTKVRMVPKMIGKLQNLETLDLKHTYVTKLPVEILKLCRLRHLLLYRYDYDCLVGGFLSFHYVHGFLAPSEIGSLCSLQKLAHIEADQTSDGIDYRIVSEVGKLTQLRRLGITKLKREYGMALCDSIEKLTNLRSLTIKSIQEDEVLDLQYPLSSTPQLLRTLVLEGHLEKVPPWIPSLHSLVTLWLRWSHLADDLLQSLQDLPNLVYLELRLAYDGKGLHFKAGGFQKLKKLDLVGLEGLSWMSVDEGSMPHLELFSLRNCNLLHALPSGLQHLTNLQELELFGMPDELIMSLRNRDKEDGDYLRIAHIPIVLIGNWKENGWVVEKLSI